VARHVAFGIYEMLRNNAANIHETSDWDVVFAVIEIVGAGASPDDLELSSNKYITEDGHAGSSENESQAAASRPGTPRERSNSIGSNSGGWIVLGNNPNAVEEKTPISAASVAKVLLPNVQREICKFLGFVHFFLSANFSTTFFLTKTV